MAEQDLEQKGILKVPVDTTKSQAENQRMRESHNANHALWYLTMVVHSVIHHKPHQNTRQKTERVLAHLAHLREFVQETGVKHRVMIEHVYGALVSENPSDHGQWTRFIYTHWNLIQSFAEHYGNREKCFPDSEYQKIADVVCRRQYLKSWWWKIQIENARRALHYQWLQLVKKLKGRKPK